MRAWDECFSCRVYGSCNYMVPGVASGSRLRKHFQFKFLLTVVQFPLSGDIIELNFALCCIC